MVLIKVESSVPVPKSQNDFLCSVRCRGHLKSWHMYPDLHMAVWTSQGGENLVQCTTTIRIKEYRHPGECVDSSYEERRVADMVKKG